MVMAVTSALLGGCANGPLTNSGGTLLPALRQALNFPGTNSGSTASPGGDASAPALGAGGPVLTPAQAEAMASPVPAAAPQAAAGAQLGGARDELNTVVPPARGDRRFSLVLSNASPETLFMALLSETQLSVAVDPALKTPMSVSLKNVTLREALDLLRELHRLEYKVIGRHIVVVPAEMETRIFAVDYPSFNRSGRSDLRVVSGSMTGNGSGSGGASSGSSAASTGNNSQPTTGGVGSGGGGGPESSRVSTSQRNDLWSEIEASIKALVGEKDGRQVIVSAQTGSIVVRALPRELRAVADYLENARMNVQRQVMLEAKVVEVQLRDSERTGINWAAFRQAASAVTVGAVAPGAALSATGALAGSLITVTPGGALASALTNTGSLLGLAFQTSNFAAVLEFLSTQGQTQVLSSPRIATMNNQKAVLKVGTDDLLVTNISTTTTAVGNSTATTPNISVQPFFSGISLDVTPNINGEGYITLHIHPAVSTVTERNKVLSLGSQGTYTLPLASSDINESDAVVRAKDGQIIAIGGLMRQSSNNTSSGIPGIQNNVLRTLLGGQTSRLSEKRELVILLKPTIIDTSKEDGLRGDALARLLEMTGNAGTAGGR